MKNRQGLSTLEIMIGVLIIAIAFLPAFRVIQYGSKATVKVNNYSKVARLAQGLIEECKHVPFKIYVKDYQDMASGETFVVNQNYYPKTLENIELAGREIKNLRVEADLTVKKEPDNRISEVWIRVKARWKEGDGTTQGEVDRELRLGNAIRNPDCYM